MLGFIKDITLSLVFAMFFCIAFELPAQTLERLILNPSPAIRESQKKLHEKCENKEEKI